MIPTTVLTVALTKICRSRFEMPEGDTIVRTARTLQLAIGGRHVTSFETVLPKLGRVNDDTPLTGRTVESVDAEGKWLLIRFSGDLILLTHMLMSGSWHIYRPGERWQRGRSHMRIVIGTAAMLAIAFDVPVAEFHTAKTLARRRGLHPLGPVVLKDDFDAQQAVANLAARPDLGIGAALMNQSLLAGLGNVFKSEVCFVCGIHPFRKVASLAHSGIEELVAAARKLMLENVSTYSSGHIVTVPGIRQSIRHTTRSADPDQNLWVYRRKGRPCRRCGAAIESQKDRYDARVTFWCPACQPFV
jgi:endonuclease-8